MGRFLLFALMMSTSFSAYSATHCACEIGQEKGQKAFYKIGCDMWLSKKKCTTKKIIDRKQNLPLAKYLPKISRGDTIAIGFVGRWLETQWTLDFVDSEIVPLLKKNVSVLYDNTGSNSMNDPDEVQWQLSLLQIPQGSQIQVMGNQTESVGMWNSILWGSSANFYASASTAWAATKFPDCPTIEGKKCSATFQSGERGRCHNTETNRKIWLSCRKPKIGGGEYEWQRE